MDAIKFDAVRKTLLDDMRALEVKNPQARLLFRVFMSKDMAKAYEDLLNSPSNPDDRGYKCSVNDGNVSYRGYKCAVLEGLSCDYIIRP